MSTHEAIKIFEELQKEFQALSADKIVIDGSTDHVNRLVERTRKAIALTFGEKTLYHSRATQVSLTNPDLFEVHKSQMLHNITLILDELRIKSD